MNFELIIFKSNFLNGIVSLNLVMSNYSVFFIDITCWLL